MYHNTFCFLIFIIFFSGCVNQTQLELALSEAGKNRCELQSVLDHYVGDSLKQASAVFLIENMPYRYGLEGNELDNLYSFYDAASRSDLSPQKVTDSIQTTGVTFAKTRLNAVPDIRNIRAEFLIDHIDSAFEIWRKQPWGKYIDFDTFCHHILPYRIGNEKLRPWLREMHTRFNPLLDSIRSTPDSANIIKVTEALIAELQKIRRNYGHGLPSGVTIGPDNTRWFAGDCREFTDIQTYIMRAVGLPGGCDKMPMNGNYFLPHFWNYVIDENGETHYCSVLFKTPFTERASNYAGPKGKVMRECFELNNEYSYRLDGYSSIDNIHPELKLYRDLIIDNNEPYFDRYAIPLGVVISGDSISKQFEIQNTSKNMITIQEILPSCDCVEASVNTDSILKGQSAILDIKVSIDSVEGPLKKYVDIYFNENENPKRYTLYGYVKQLGCSVLCSKISSLY